MSAKQLARIGAFFLALAGAGPVAFAATAEAPLSESVLSGQVEGAPQLVLKRSVDGCEPRFLPDTAATAFRDSAGKVHLFATWQHNYAMVGPSLDTVKMNCALLYKGAKSPDPAAFDDNAWLTSFYTEDGRTIYALAHDEYHGYEHPGKCAESAKNRCWYNAITATQSRDGGASFEHPDPARSLVATIPYRYGDLRMPAGMFEPTNIVRMGEYYYVMASLLAPEKGRSGVCLMRTDHLADAASWRGWDGKDFTVKFVNPYAAAAAEPARLCQALAPEVLKWHVTALVHHAKKDVFVAVMQATTTFPKNAVSQDGVYIATSPDLVHWSRISLLMPAASKFTYACGGAEPVAHPALLDPTAPDRNFTEIGDRPYLYYTLDHPVTCRISTNADLFRVQVTLH